MRFLRLGSAGMRGEVGTALTCQHAMKFASAFASWLGGGTVAVAMDTRISSPMIREACFAGLLSCGVQVVDLGVCPAPLLHFAVKKLQLSGGILIGAGHHPAGWNALVAIADNGACLTAVQSQEMLDIYHSGMFALAPWNKMGKIEKAPAGIVAAYAASLLKLVDVSAIAAKRFKIVLDFCNGSGSRIFREITDKLHCEVIPINDALSGRLPHDPEPRPRSSAQVKSIMRPLGADIGFVFSSDVGRCAIVTDTSETLSEEYTYPLAADNVFSKVPPRSVAVTNWCTTSTLDKIVEAHDGILCKGRTGETFTTDLMLQKNAVIAGDGSGGIAVPDSGVFGFDGFAAMLLVLESMALRNAPCSELVKNLPRMHIVKKSIPCRSVNAYAAMKYVKELFPGARVDDSDGLRFDFSDGWIHIRASKTEPILRMILEWKDADTAEEKARNIRASIERMVHS